MWREIFLILLLITFFQQAYSQPPGTVSERLKAQKEMQSETDAFEQNYETRIGKEMLYGVYIPKDLADAFNQLNQKTDKTSRKKFADMSEEEARYKLHFSLGRWMINNWGFYGGSRLSKYLKDIGIHNPDDMARFLIITYHRELNEHPLGVKELVESFQEMRQKEREERLKKGTILHQETRKRPKKENN